MIALVLKHPLNGAVLCGVFLAGLLLLFIIQMNALTASVYRIGDQEKQLEQLKEQSILLNARELPAFSRARIEKLAESMDFERVQNVSYLRVLSRAVARNTN